MKTETASIKNVYLKMLGKPCHRPHYTRGIDIPQGQKESFSFWVYGHVLNLSECIPTSSCK
jgi:hypothetical protein